MMGQNHQNQIVTMCLYERCANMTTLFSTILNNLALGHEIDRHFWRGVELK